MIYFWLLFISTFSILVLPELLSIGMFFDGVVYATIARNLAEGIGSLWEPVYVSKFLQHPPLMYWLESLFFRIFGDYLFVEKLYSLFTGVLAAYLIKKLWDTVLNKFDKTEDNKLSKQIAWFPLLLWIITPIVYWTYKYNMLENTLTIFCLLATLFSIKALNIMSSSTDNKSKSTTLFILATVSIFLALLTKGPVGLFPLAVPYIYWFVYRDVKLFRIIVLTILRLGLLTLLIYLLMQHEKAGEFIRTYYNEQLFPNILAKTSEHLSVLKRLAPIKSLFIDNLASMIILGVVIFVIGYKKRVILSTNNKKAALMFIILGVAASFPTIISSKHRAYYVVPSIPHYALALGFLCLNSIKVFYKNINIKGKNFTIFKKVVVMLLILGLMSPIFSINKIRRDHEILEDLIALNQYIPTYTIIGVSESMKHDWALYAYMARLFHNSISPQSEISLYSYLKKEDSSKNLNASQVNISTKKYNLYVLK